MGYNGSNRRGARSSMWKKSSSRAGINMLFSKRGVVTGLFDIGSAIKKDVMANTTTNTSRQYDYQADQKHYNKPDNYSKQSIASIFNGTAIVFLLVAMVFFLVAYITEWYNLFYILGYSLFYLVMACCIGEADNIEQKKYQWIFKIGCIFLIGYAAIAPFYLFFLDIWHITFTLISLSVILPIYFFIRGIF